MKPSKRAGNDKLNQALADLIAAQANLVTAQAGLANVQASMQANHLALERETAERFARIENVLSEIQGMLQGLPEAVRQRIGFERPAGD